MFRIEDAIENWKNSLLEKQTLTTSDIEELESHLQDEFDSLKFWGLNEEESFLIAARRIGDTTSVAVEYAKINTTAIWKTRFFWMIFGIVAVQFFSAIAIFFARGGALLGCHLAGWSELNSGVIFGFLQITFLLFFLFVFYFAAVNLSAFRKIRKWTLISTIVSVITLTVLIGKINEVGFNLLIIKLWSPEQLKHFTMGCSFSGLGLSFLWPIMWFILLLWLMPRKTQST